MFRDFPRNPEKHSNQFGKVGWFAVGINILEENTGLWRRDIRKQLKCFITDRLVPLTPPAPLSSTTWPKCRYSLVKYEAPLNAPTQKEGFFLLFTLLEKRSGWGIFLSRVPSQYKHMPIVSKSVQNMSRPRSWCQRKRLDICRERTETVRVQQPKIYVIPTRSVILEGFPREK